MKGAAWAVPAVAVAVAVPIAAASGPDIPRVFSSWGNTDGTVTCGRCSGSSGTYSWTIDNTSSSGLSYHGVLFPNASVGQVYSNIINIYWLPFNSGTVSNQSGTGTGKWSAPVCDAATYGTIIGPGSHTYYPWVTKLTGPVTVGAGDVDSNGVFHLTPDYKFTIKSNSCVTGGDLWVSHAYTYSLNSTQMSNCSGSYNGNYCGGSANYPTTSNNDMHWRNNGWVGPLDDGCSNNRLFGVQQQNVVSPESVAPSDGTATTESTTNAGPWYV
ncbi:hypothetical protein [Humibacter ginsenosidimutans]|uniref:Uncharacterized protein n=1 Tax=Humibacter ginsenosidimutans TaxID=2599293 RepID=A0A5B8M3Q8_9MICO|nr:hypothetical protein [Humibacter ginsenosidimutans]QDZ14993.1 hypothetical protein FPZ11_09650 [Humibacter ginsenosidimutans]